MIYDLTPAQIVTVKDEIANYRKVLTQDFLVPSPKLFATLAISKTELDSFLAQNPGITGVRVYFSKITNIQANDDYQLDFVPCMELQDVNGDTYYEDRLEVAPGQPGKVITTACRVPPGCPFGAKLL